VRKLPVDGDKLIRDETVCLSFSGGRIQFSERIWARPNAESTICGGYRGKRRDPSHAFAKLTFASFPNERQEILELAKRICKKICPKASRWNDHRHSVRGIHRSTLWDAKRQQAHCVSFQSATRVNREEGAFRSSLSFAKSRDRTH